MKFYIKQKVFSLKDKFNILDENQILQYQVHGKMMSLSNKLEFKNDKDEVLLRAQRKVFSFLPKYFIFDNHNQEVAEIKRLFGIRPRFNLTVRYKDLDVSGSLFAHSFVVEDNGITLATISKKIISWGDTYEIEIYKEEDIELLLFVVIVLDQVIHERRN